jgi:hypothetical protein
MRRLSVTLLLALCLAQIAWSQEIPAGVEYRRLPVADYLDHMKAGWIGQIAGVSFGAPTEFKWQGSIIPANQTPVWKDDLLNSAFGQDDLYVEMTFLRTLQEYGLGVSTRQAGIDFANSEYAVWCANRAGRNNLRAGIAPPDSGHPHFSRNSDDIDYQIEADFSGLVAPGLPETVIALGDKFGRMVNYGDGLYAGMFIGGLYAEAFFESDLHSLIAAGLACIPAESQYAEMVRDVLSWYQENPDNWEATWGKVNDKYVKNPDYHRYAGAGIDAKTNGAYVLIGLLYGKGDPEQTMAIACRCGMDSDCNPSSAAGVLFATIGYDKLPAHFRDKLNLERKFSYTAYNFPGLVAACEQVAREAVVQAGGRIEKDPTGEEVFVIPVQKPQPLPVERSWEPGPIVDARFTPEERARIRFPDEVALGLSKTAPGWQLSNCGFDMGAPALLSDFRGRKDVFVTHPLDQTTGSVLSRDLAIPEGKQTSLNLVVGHDSRGDWKLIVRADGKVLLEQTVGRNTTDRGWLTKSVDLSEFAGKTIHVELVNQPTGWAWEAAYWSKVEVVSR